MRLGKFSGKIYKGEREIATMQECGVVITEEHANDEEWIQEHHLDDLRDCIRCCGCPVAQENIIGG